MAIQPLCITAQDVTYELGIATTKTTISFTHALKEGYRRGVSTSQFHSCSHSTAKTGRAICYCIENLCKVEIQP